MFKQLVQLFAEIFLVSKRSGCSNSSDTCTKGRHGNSQRIFHKQSRTGKSAPFFLNSNANHSAPQSEGLFARCAH